MGRSLLWIGTVSVGITAVFLTGFLGPAVFPLVVVAAMVMVKVDRVIALSGLMTGYGGTWVLLLATQLSSGALPDRSLAWVVGGGALLTTGLLLLGLAVAQTRLERWLAAH